MRPFASVEIGSRTEADAWSPVSLRVTSTAETPTAGEPAPRVVAREVPVTQAPATEPRPGKATARKVAFAQDARVATAAREFARAESGLRTEADAWSPVSLRVTSTAETPTAGEPAPRVVAREVPVTQAPATEPRPGKATARKVAFAQDARVATAAREFARAESGLRTEADAWSPDLRHRLARPEGAVVREGRVYADVKTEKPPSGFAAGTEKASEDGVETERGLVADVRTAKISWEHLQVRREIVADRERLPEWYTEVFRRTRSDARPTLATFTPQPRRQASPRVRTPRVEAGATRPREQARPQTENAASVADGAGESVKGRPSRVQAVALAREGSGVQINHASESDLTEVTLRASPVENEAGGTPEPSQRHFQNPQAGKAVENAPQTQESERVDVPRQWADLDAKSFVEALVRVGEGPASREVTVSELMLGKTVVYGAKESVSRAIEVLDRQVDRQGDDHGLRHREPGVKQAEIGYTVAQRGADALRTDPVDLEAYRLTLATSRTAPRDDTEGLKSFRNQGLAGSEAVLTGNPQAVEKKVESESSVRPTQGASEAETAERRSDFGQQKRHALDEMAATTVVRPARQATSEEAKRFFATIREGLVEQERDRRTGKAPAGSQHENPERGTPRSLVAESSPDSNVDAPQPKERVDLLPFVERSEAGLTPRGQGAAKLPKAEPVEVGGPRPVMVPKPTVVTPPSGGPLPDKVPDMPADRPVVGSDTGRKALVETALLDRRPDQNALQVHVKDEQLGRVVVRLTERAGLIRAMVRTEGTQSRELLTQQLPALMESLVRRGFEARQDGLAEQSPEGRESAHPRDEQRRQRQSQRQRREGRGTKPEFRIRLN